jgi:cytochrome c peroxidase
MGRKKGARVVWLLSMAFLGAGVCGGDFATNAQVTSGPASQEVELVVLPPEPSEPENPDNWPGVDELLDFRSEMDIRSVKLDRVLPRLKEFVKPGQERTAIALGKALFWDQQVGSDRQACASCHFHAGADNRVKNQLNGGAPHDPAKAGRLDPTKSGAAPGPIYSLQSEDFPFQSDDVSGSQGAACKSHGFPRLTTSRNASTTINAILQFRSFWDGRANNHFNGVSPFGPREFAGPGELPDSRLNQGTSAHRILKVVKTQDARTGGVIVNVRPVQLDLPNAALASQAMGPPVNGVEMGCQTWPEIGQKLLKAGARPLYGQKVDFRDSVLGRFAHPAGGLNTTYRELIRRVFLPVWWDDPRKPEARLSGELAMMENNFSLFFGVSVLLYESTLVSDDTPFDRFIQRKPLPASVPANIRDGLQNGFQVFLRKGKCVACHRGPDLTSAGYLSHQPKGVGEERVEWMPIKEGRSAGAALFDDGFYNLGVRPSGEDLGIGGVDGYGHPLSFTRQYLRQISSGQSPLDSFSVDPCGFKVQPCEPLREARSAVNGTFKVPTLRNVELTGPYMHTGGYATLEQVVEFYDQGGRFPGNPQQSPEVKKLFLTSKEKADLVAFMKSLTDERVRCEQAPFDHPSLTLPQGYRQSGGGSHVEEFSTLPAVGTGGRKAKGLACLASYDSQFSSTQLRKGGGKS